MSHRIIIFISFFILQLSVCSQDELSNPDSKSESEGGYDVKGQNTISEPLSIGENLVAMFSRLNKEVYFYRWSNGKWILLSIPANGSILLGNVYGQVGIKFCYEEYENCDKFFISGGQKCDVLKSNGKIIVQYTPWRQKESGDLR